MGILDRVASEVTYLRGALRTLKRVTAIAKNREHTLPDELEDLAMRFADRVALIGEDRRYSFAGLNARANQYAHWAYDIGLRQGDTVSLMMPNSAEYMAIWLGVTRMGGRVALLNTNLTGHSLGHCMAIVPSRHTIFDPRYLDAHGRAMDHVPVKPKLWLAGEGDGGQPLFPAVDAMPKEGLADKHKPDLTTDDPALYIYTSGTTGLPKAAVLNHYRVLAIMNGFSAVCDAQPEDRIYVAQPMYHTAGGVLAIGIALTVGGSAVVRERFSASRFWDDLVAEECTAFQYIGELCRYLLNAPTSDNETRHNLRFCNGNGLRPDIWTDFKTRFRIPKIIEWYAATEGNVTLFNMDGKPGSVGRIPKWLSHRFPTKIVRFDIAEERPVRDVEGHCIECDVDEVGEAIGRILNDPSKPAQRFDGYANEAETEKKILRDVFEPGDAWFRTGDLMRKDALGYFYFIDRIGDTFRWKGENVSTSEVEEVVSVFPGVREVNVYGVEVAHHNGRAGMAAITCDEELDIDALHGHIAEQLPIYARPIFLRLQKALDVTGTFKVRKVDLREEGFDPRRSEDPVYFANPETNGFERIDTSMFKKIDVGDYRL